MIPPNRSDTDERRYRQDSERSSLVSLHSDKALVIMEVLSAAAAAAPPAPGAIPGAAAAPELPQVELPGAAPPPARKPKRTRRQIAQDSVAEATQKIAGFTAAKASSLAAAAVSTGAWIKQRHVSKAQSHTDNIHNWEEKLKERQEKLKGLEP